MPVPTERASTGTSSTCRGAAPADGGAECRGCRRSRPDPAGGTVEDPRAHRVAHRRGTSRSRCRHNASLNQRSAPLRYFSMSRSVYRRPFWALCDGEVTAPRAFRRVVPNVARLRCHQIAQQLRLAIGLAIRTTSPRASVPMQPGRSATCDGPGPHNSLTRPSGLLLLATFLASG